MFLVMIVCIYTRILAKHIQRTGRLWDGYPDFLVLQDVVPTQEMELGELPQMWTGPASPDRGRCLYSLK